MATFRNRHGMWQARITRKNQQPIAKSFLIMQDSERWSRQVETEIDKDSYTNLVLADKSLFKVVIERHIQEVTLATQIRGKAVFGHHGDYSAGT